MKLRTLTTTLAALALTACAAFEPRPGSQIDTEWVWDGQVTTRIIWVQTAPETVAAYCPDHRAPERGACAVRLMNDISGRPTCRVYAAMTEWQAREAWTVSITGTPIESLYDHEARHCAGWRHPIAGAKS